MSVFIEDAKTNNLEKKETQKSSFLKVQNMLEDYPDVLTIVHLKEILHYSSNTTIYKLIRDGKLKAVHTKGNKYLIPKKYVIEYLLDN